MTSPPSKPPVHRSVFGKLVLIMLVMAFCLVGTVFGFFLHFVNPMVGLTVDRMLGDYGRRISDSLWRPELFAGYV